MQLKRKKTYLYTILGIALLLLLARLLFVGNTFRNIGAALRPLSISVLIIYLLAPLVNRLEEKLHWPRVLCLFLTYLVFIVFIFLFFYFLLPDLIQNILQILPESYEELVELLCSHPFFGRFITEDFLYSLAEALPFSGKNVQTFLSYSSRMVGSLASSLRWLSLMLVSLTMAFYGLLTTRSLGAAAGSFLYKMLPAPWTDRILSLIYIIDRALRDFVISKLFTCSILGFLVYLAILLCNLIFRLQIPSPLLIALITAFFNLIPYIGPFLGTIPCLLLALFRGWAEAAVLLGILLLAQQIDNIIIEPRVLSQSAGVSPFWILASVTGLSLLFNPFASVFAVPAASVLRSLLHQYQESRRLRKSGLPDTVFLRTVPSAWQKDRPVSGEEP